MSLGIPLEQQAQHVDGVRMPPEAAAICRMTEDTMFCQLFEN